MLVKEISIYFALEFGLANNSSLAEKSGQTILLLLRHFAYIYFSIMCKKNLLLIVWDELLVIFLAIYLISIRYIALINWG